MTDIPNIYREARVARPMTQEELAIAAGVSVRTIRRLENGPESRRAVSAVLGLFDLKDNARGTETTFTPARLEVKGQGKLEGLDVEGLTVLDLVLYFCTGGSMILFLTGLMAWLRTKADAIGADLPEHSIPDWAMWNSGYPTAFAGFLALVLALALWDHLRLGRRVTVDLELERRADVTIPEAVARAMDACRTGSHVLVLGGVDAPSAELEVTLARRSPEVLGHLVAALRGVGIDVRRKQDTSGRRGTGDIFGADYL